MNNTIYIIYCNNHSDGYYVVYSEDGFIESLDIAEYSEIKEFYEKKGYNSITL